MKTASLSRRKICLAILLSALVMFVSFIELAAFLPIAAAASPGYSYMCNPDTFGEGSGMYAGPSGGAFSEDVAGYLEWCNHGSLTVIAGPPSAPTSAFYYGLGGIQTSTGLDLVLSESDGHFWFCINATPTGCAFQSTLISLSSSFCSSTPIGACNPMGVALDPKLNIYYADPTNGFIYECTSASSYLSCTIPGWGLLPGLNHHYVTGLFRASNGTFYMSDGSSDPSCVGNVWKGIPGQSSETLWTPPGGGGWDSITLSNANPQKKLHIYVGGDGCGGGFAGVRDVTDSISSNGYIFLPSPYTSGGLVYGLTPKLQFLPLGGAAYKTTDKS